MPDSADLDSRLAEQGFRPIAEAPNPIDADRYFLLRLGENDYMVGYQADGGDWFLREIDDPVEPTHLKPCPRD